MRLADLSPTARTYVLAVCALAVLSASIAWTRGDLVQDWGLFLLLTAVAALAHSFPVSAPGKQAYHVSLPFFACALVLLTPPQVVAALVAVHLAEWARRRRSPVAQAFNL